MDAPTAPSKDGDKDEENFREFSELLSYSQWRLKVRTLTFLSICIKADVQI